MVLVAREEPERHVRARTHLEHDPAVRELGHDGRILDRPHAVRDARDRQLEGGTDRLGSRVLAGVDRAAEPGAGGDLVRTRELPGWEARLVAHQVEPDDVRVAVALMAAGDRLGSLDAEVADRG